MHLVFWQAILNPVSYAYFEMSTTVNCLEVLTSAPEVEIIGKKISIYWVFYRVCYVVD